MIQDIGINISATGASQVANEFNQIGNALQHLKTGLSGLNQVQSAITNLSSKLTTLDGAAHKLRSAGADIASFARQGSSALSTLNGQITALTSNMAHLTRAGHGGGTPGGGGSTMFGSMGFLGPLRFMVPYYAAMRAMQGIKYGTTEIAMGGSREEIAKSNINLAAVSADRDQVRGHVWASICQTCRRCRDEKGIEKCDDASCPLNRYINTPWEWRSWNVYRMAHALLEHCYSECGPTYPVCQNLNGIAPQCPSFRGKQAAVQMDKPKQKRTDRSCRPITGNGQEENVCQS